MKNSVFWEIEILFVSHRRHITSTLKNSARKYHARFEVFAAVTMKNVVFLDIKIPVRASIVKLVKIVVIGITLAVTNN
jgi:hypothetical protein